MARPYITIVVIMPNPVVSISIPVILMRRRELDSTKFPIHRGVAIAQSIESIVKKLPAAKHSQSINHPIASATLFGGQDMYVVGTMIRKLVEIRNDGSASRNMAMRAAGDLDRNWLDGLVDIRLLCDAFCTSIGCNYCKN